jgi:hypothetical protein
MGHGQANHHGGRMDVFVEPQWSAGLLVRARFRDSFQILPRTGAAKATSSRRPFCLSANPTLAPFLRQSHLGLACRRNRLPTPLCCPLPIPPGLDVARQPITLPLASSTTAVSRSTAPIDRPGPLLRQLASLPAAHLTAAAAAAPVSRR